MAKYRTHTLPRGGPHRVAHHGARKTLAEAHALRTYAPPQVILQIGIGVLSVNLELSQPFVTVAHQLVAALLVALLSALSFKAPKQLSPPLSVLGNDSSALEACNG